MTQTAEHRSYVTPLSLWLGVLGMPITWFIYLVLGWGISELGCKLGLGNFQLFGLNSVVTWIAIATVIALLAAIGTGVVAIRNWRLVGRGESLVEDPVTADKTLERRQFMAQLGVMLSLLFLLLIILSAIPPFVLPPCEGLG